MQLPKNVELHGRITAQEAAARFAIPFKLRTVCRAIDAGIVRGETIAVGKRFIRLVDPDEFADDLANLPVCGYEGCSRPALAPSGACSGPHARALETKGRSWRTPEAIAKSAAGIRGRPRPDVGERVAAMHADKEARAEWGLKLAKGRRLPAQSVNRWHGRLGGTRGARAAGRVSGKRPVEELYPAEARRALELRADGLSLRRIASEPGLTKREVEGVISRASRLSP